MTKFVVVLKKTSAVPKRHSVSSAKSGESSPSSAARGKSVWIGSAKEEQRRHLMEEARPQAAARRRTQKERPRRGK